jgi:hypothetical protein
MEDVAVVLEQFKTHKWYEFGNLYVSLRREDEYYCIRFYDKEYVSILDMSIEDFLDAIHHRNPDNSITLPKSAGYFPGYHNLVKLLRPGDQYGSDIDWDSVVSTFTGMKHLLVKSSGKY